MPEAPVSPEKPPQALLLDRNIVNGIGRWIAETTKQPRGEIKKLLQHPPNVTSAQFKTFIEVMEETGIVRMNKIITGLTESRKVTLAFSNPSSELAQEFTFIGDDLRPPTPGIYIIPDTIASVVIHAVRHNILGVPGATLEGFSELIATRSSDETAKKWAAIINQKAKEITKALDPLTVFNPKRDMAKVVVGSDGKCLLMLIPKAKNPEEKKV